MVTSKRTEICGFEAYASNYVTFVSSFRPEVKI